MITGKTLHTLLWAMSQPHTFYVLGAGVSYGLIPITKDFRQVIKEEFHSVGVYQTSPYKSSPLFERVIGQISPDEEDIQEILLTHIPPSALDFLVQRALWRPRSDIVPPQYAVFDLVPSPATLFNFNLDGLASLYCGQRHIVLEPHGRIDEPWFKREDYRELLEATLVYEVSINHLTPKLLPAPEPEDIALDPSYSFARKLFRHARAMVILGYSFGQTGTLYDDAQSFEFVVTLLKQRPCPVFVLSPTPYELEERLRDRLSTYNVHGISLRWELFSGILLASINPFEGISPLWCDKQILNLCRSYESALDAL